MHKYITLNSQEFDQMLEAIENPPKPNIKFKELCNAYKEFLDDVWLSETEVREIELMLLEADLDE